MLADDLENASRSFSSLANNWVSWSAPRLWLSGGLQSLWVNGAVEVKSLFLLLRVFLFKTRRWWGGLVENKGRVSGNWCLSVLRVIWFSLALCACFTCNLIAWKPVPESCNVFIVNFRSIFISHRCSDNRRIGKGGTGHFARQVLGVKRWVLCVDAV